MKRGRAFTLIELLTVMAIIALLAAITFPVFARVKLNAYKSSDLSSMNSIRTAIQIYKADQEGYPPALLGYITPYEYTNGVTVVPANQLRGALYPKKIDSLDTMRGSLNRSNNTLMVPAAWPPADPRAAGTSPVGDLDGNGVIDAADDTASTRQAYASTYPGTLSYYYFDPSQIPSIGGTNNNATTTAGRFYAVSGYDVNSVNLGTGATTYELRYTLFWTSYGIGNGSAADDSRQLGYTDPPENTVVTWNSSYRDYQGNTLTNGGSKDLVLFLGGSARPVDSKLMSERNWRLTQ